MPGITAHGFVRGEGGIVAIDVPGAIATVPIGINNRGVIVGRAALNDEPVAFVAVRQ